MADKIIKFIPDFVVKDIDTQLMSKTINENLRDVVKDYCGSRVMIRQNKMDIEIIFNPSEDTVNTNPIAKTGIRTESTYTIKDDFKNKLGDYINVKAPVITEDFVKKGKTFIIMKLNVQKVINKILEPCPQGYQYIIANHHMAEKGNYGVITFYQVKTKQDNNNNHNNNNNGRQNQQTQR